jgi:hypothetical protein
MTDTVKLGTAVNRALSSLAAVLAAVLCAVVRRSRSLVSRLPLRVATESIECDSNLKGGHEPRHDWLI